MKILELEVGFEPTKEFRRITSAVRLAASVLQHALKQSSTKKHNQPY